MPDQFNFSDVFISYSRRNTDFVKRLDQAFKAEGLEVWVDWEDIPLSADWWAEIKAGIEAAEAFVFVISPDSVRSNVCRDEINHAIECGKRFIPLLHQDIIEKEDQEAMHGAISSHNWIFCRDNDEFDVAFKKLLGTIQTDFEHQKMHTRLLVRAREWSDKHADSSLLLAGNDLAEAEKWLKQSEGKSPTPTDNHFSYIESSTRYRRQQRLIFMGVVFAIAIFIVLSIGLFIAQQQAQTNADIAATSAVYAIEQANIAATSESVAIEQAFIAATQQAIAETNAALAATSEAVAREQAIESNAIAHTISQVSIGQQLFEKGDSFAALPYIMDAMNTRPIPFAELNLAKIAYSTGASMWLNGHGARILEVATSPVENLAATASRDDSVIIWNLETGEKAHVLQGHTADANSVDFSPDGQTVVSAGSDGKVLLWDVDSGAMTDLYTVEAIGLDVRFSPLGDAVAVSLRFNQGTDDNADDTFEVHVISIESGEVLQIISTDTSAINSIAFNPSGETILTGMSPVILEWRLDFLQETSEETADEEATESGDLGLDAVNTQDEENTTAETATTTVEPIRVFAETGGGNILYLAFNHAGTQFLATSSNSNITIWNYSTGTVSRTLTEHGDVVNQAGWLPDDKRIFSASPDRSMILWNVETTQPIAILSGHPNIVTAAGVSYDGRRAITGESVGVGMVWDLAVDSLINHYAIDNTLVNAVAYHPTEPIAVAGLEDGRIQFWNLENGQLLSEPANGHTSFIHDIEFTPDGKYVVSASRDCRLIVWDVATYEPVHYLGENTCSGNEGSTTAHTGAVYDVDISSDGTLAVSTGVEGHLLFWNLETGEFVKRIENVAGTRLFQAIFAPDEQSVFITANSRLLEVNIESGEIVREFFGETLNAVSLRISPDESSLIITLLSRIIVTWDIATGEQKQVYRGHQAAIWTATYNNDGSQIISAADDGTVLVWDVETGEVLRRFSYNAQIRDMVVSPDGKYILFGENGMTRIRLLSSEELIDWVHENRIYDLLSCEEQGDFITTEACLPDDGAIPEIGQDPVRGYVYFDADDRWQFEGQAGDIVTIVVQADNSTTGEYNAETATHFRRLDSVIDLLGSDGETIASNDDDENGGTTNSAIRNFELPADGIYQIVVKSFGSSGLGDYTLTLDLQSGE